MYKSYSMELAGRTLTVDIGRVCAQANGAALLKYGETTVLSTATASDKPRDGVDFFPLSVEFEEKMYSVGKIPVHLKRFVHSDIFGPHFFVQGVDDHGVQGPLCFCNTRL